MDHFQHAMSQLLDGQTLDQSTSHGILTEMLQGRLNDAQIGAILALLATHDATAEELTGAAQAMRRQVRGVEYPLSDNAILIDTCGTGGAPKTFNVSTAAAIILAGVQPPAGSGIERIQVAKHGNRSRTGRGSAEVLMALGVQVDASVETQTRCLEEAGVCFCFAVNHHPAVKYAMPARKSLGVPTIFNAIGPLTNPAGAQHQLIGVYKDELVLPMAQTLLNLGTTRAMVVHSTDGLDELSTTAPTRVVHVCDGQLREELVDAATLGMERVTIEAVQASDVEHSAQILRSIVDNEPSAFAEMALLTVAGGLVVAGVADGFGEGIELGRATVALGHARAALDALVSISND